MREPPLTDITRKPNAIKEYRYRRTCTKIQTNAPKYPRLYPGTARRAKKRIIRITLKGTCPTYTHDIAGIKTHLTHPPPPTCPPLLLLLLLLVRPGFHSDIQE